MLKPVILMPFIVAAVIFTGYPAFAQEDSHQPAQDHITYETSVEGWVVTKTAKVTISVDAGGNSEDGISIRQEIEKAVYAIAPKTDWRLVDFSRSQDDAGLEKWHASFEGRLVESDLPGIELRADKSSRSGMKLHVDDVSFTPTLAEQEEEKGELRLQLYKMALAELDRINQVFPGRSYRIGEINFTANLEEPLRPRPMVRNAAMFSSAALPATSSDNAQISQRVEQTMAVEFAAMPVAVTGKP